MVFICKYFIAKLIVIIEILVDVTKPIIRRMLIQMDLVRVLWHLTLRTHHHNGGRPRNMPIKLWGLLNKLLKSLFKSSDVLIQRLRPLLCLSSKLSSIVHLSLMSTLSKPKLGGRTHLGLQTWHVLWWIRIVYQEGACLFKVVACYIQSNSCIRAGVSHFKQCFEMLLINISIVRFRLRSCLS